MNKLRILVLLLALFPVQHLMAQVPKKVIVEHFTKAERSSWTLSIENQGTVNEFWQRVDPSTGTIIHDFTDSDWLADDKHRLSTWFALRGTVVIV